MTINLDNLDSSGYIGTDETGKGDYFGPLVVGAVGADPASLDLLRLWNVRDSKKLSPRQIIELSGKIRKQILHSVVVIGPKKYNEMYDKIGNLNELLAWAHARAIENVLSAGCNLETIVVDRFANEYVLLNRLGTLGKSKRIIQHPRAEVHPGVAAASILARDELVRRFDLLSREIGITLKRGATEVIGPGRRVYRKGGLELLSTVAKLHFKTTKKIVDAENS